MHVRISIAFKVLAPFALFIVVYVLFAYSTIRDTIADTNLQHAQSRANELLDSVVVAVESDISERNFRRIVTSIALSEDIDTILVIDPEKNWVVASNSVRYRRKDTDKLPVHILEAANSLTADNSTTFLPHNDLHYLFAGKLQALDSANNEIQEYALVILFNKHQLSQNFAVLESRLIEYFSLAIFLLLLVGFVVIKRFISDPLTVFKRAMQTKDREYEQRKISLASKDEFGDLAEEYNRMLLIEEASLELARHTTEEAEFMAEKKSEFLATMSHEIRTPINGILGLTQLAMKADTLPEVKDYLDKLMSSGNLLLEIVNDILDFTKLLEGKITVDPHSFSPRESFHMIVEMMLPAAQVKGIELSIDVDKGVPDIVEGDSHRLKQVLTNLVGNAVKFTDSGFVTIKCRWESDNEARGTLQIEVEDSGVGIEQEKLPDIFDAFSQEDNTTARKYGGTGLGLAISQQLVLAMHGSIYVNSNKGEGSTFGFRIPCQEVSYFNYLQSLEQSEFLPRVKMITTATARVKHAVNAINTFSQSEQVVGLFDGQQANELVQNIDAVLFSGALVVDHDGNSALPDAVPMEVMTEPFSLLTMVDKLQRLTATTDKEVDSQPDRQSKRTRVLLVEDNDINQLIVEEMLESIGVEVVCADNGAIALKVLQKFDVDLVLMDVQMPEMDGYQATKAIRDELKMQLPIIGLSANVLPEDVQKGLDSGMNSYLNKPVMLEDLKQELEKWV